MSPDVWQVGAPRVKQVLWCPPGSTLPWKLIGAKVGEQDGVLARYPVLYILHPTKEGCGGWLGRAGDLMLVPALRKIDLPISVTICKTGMDTRTQNVQWKQKKMV